MVIAMYDTQPESATTFHRDVFGRVIAFTVRGDGCGISIAYPDAPPHHYIGRMSCLQALRVIALMVARSRLGISSQGVSVADTAFGSRLRQGAR